MKDDNVYLIHVLECFDKLKNEMRCKEHCYDNI